MKKKIITKSTSCIHFLYKVFLDLFAAVQVTEKILTVTEA